MFGIRTFLVGLLAGACGGLFAANYHVVRTVDGVVVVPRTQRPPLRSSYVDVRTWSQAMWSNHPEVTEALTADGRQDLIGAKRASDSPEELIPEQTRTPHVSRSRNVARQTQRLDTSHAVTTKTVSPSGAKRWLDTQSPARQRLGAVLDEAIAPIVDDDPADLVADQASDVLPENDNNEALVRQLEEKLGQRFDSTVPLPAETNASQFEAIPASSDSSEMARDLLKQVIPQGGRLPRSAAPLRDFGRDLFSAPAPGQGAASQALPRVPAQSQVIRSSPF